MEDKEAKANKLYVIVGGTQQGKSCLIRQLANVEEDTSEFAIEFKK